METTNCVFELHNFARRTRCELQYDDLGYVGPDHDRTFIQRVILDGKVYPAGVGKTKKDAKHNAAENALRCLLENEYQDSADAIANENYNSASSQQEESSLTVSNLCNRIRLLGVNSLHTEKERRKQTNYIGIVDHYCRRTNRCHTYMEERRCGPPHNPRFVIKLLIDNKEYPEAEGKTIKEARQNAARLAWSALQEQSDWNSKVSVRSTVSEDGGPPTLSARSTSLESQESSSQSPSMTTSASIIFTDSSNFSNAQLPLRSAVSQDDAPTRLSTPTSLESVASSQSMSMGTSGSEIFTDSSNSSKDQYAIKDKNMRKSRNETSTPSRFTSDFDSMECLGRGAYGCVYKARHKLSGKYYAVKIVCRKRDEEKCLREVGTLSDLHHPNIVRYNTSWMEDSGYQWDISAGSWSSSLSSDNSPAKYLYIQMELCDTKTLKEWIEEKNTLEDTLQDSKRREESLRIVQQIVCGVECIHSKKHIHRDLKPENILFGLDGEVKIGDFGLVTADNDDDAENLMMRTGYRGTTTYMAPEQMTANTYDRKVDIFPLGLIYFELLWKLSTGHERGKVWDDARSQKFPEEFSLTFPKEDQVIKSMLCQEPEDRPEASALKTELEKLALTFSALNT